MTRPTQTSIPVRDSLHNPRIEMNCLWLGDQPVSWYISYYAYCRITMFLVKLTGNENCATSIAGVYRALDCT
jgi:hypothetical protein